MHGAAAAEGGQVSTTTRSVSFTVPLVPPTVNMYVRHTRNGRHYVTAEAKAFKAAMCLLSKRAGILPAVERYEVEAHIYLGHGQRGDVDNFAKCLLDGLQEAGIIESDALVSDLILRRRRDRKAPRTEITVRAHDPLI